MTENTDELDAFMNNLTQTVKLQDKKKLETELNNAIEELQKIDKLLQFVQSGSKSIPTTEVTNKPKARNIETLQPAQKKPKVSKPPLPLFPEPPQPKTTAQPTFVPEYDDDYSEVPMQFHLNQ